MQNYDGKKRPKISVIVPVYNVEQYLERCLQSLVKQSIDSIEIILVDDGSPDKSPAICDNYAKMYSNIHVIHKENEGLGMARNSGLAVASGEYVAFVDSDDIVEINAYEKMYTYAKKHNADTCLCGFKRLRNNGQIIDNPHPYGNNLISGNHNIREQVLLNMIGSPPDYWDDIYLMMAVWMGIYSLDLIRKNNIKFCSERQFISEDIIFDLDYYAFSQRVAFIEDLLYIYCENTTSLTLSYKKDRYDKQITLFEEIERKCDALKIDAKERIYRSFIGRARQCVYQEAMYLSMFEAYKNIKKICSDNYFRKAISVYSVNSLTYKQRGFILLMKFRCILLLFFLVKIFK